MAVGGETRLAELLGGLSLACELADGFAPESVMRTVLLAMAIGRRHGLSPVDLRDLYYVTLFRYLGCTGFAHEETHIYGAGDDIATRRTMSLADPAQRVSTMKRVARGVGGSGRLADGALAVARIFGDGVAFGRHARAQCETSIRLARIVRLGDRVQRALAQVCERWDGKGEPAHVAEGTLDLVTRVHHAAEVLELTLAERGGEEALREVRMRAGKHLDPDIACTIERDARALIAVGETTRPFEDFLDAEPEPHAAADDARVDDVALAFALMADLKSVFTLGHSTEVARVAERIIRALAGSEEETRLVRRAALLHDVGRVAIPNSVWDKPGRFSVAEWERARLHAYYTERVLWQAPALRPVASVASAAHERLDGRGYHRSLPASLSSLGGRVLAVSDVYVAVRELRPHRPAAKSEGARQILLGEAREGRLDAAVVRALLDTETGEAPRRGAWPKGLSDREVEVLRLVARGKTNKEVASELDLSPKTVQHHVAHVYGKIGVESRAAAALFATEAGLLAPA
jgi:HD-GYP domain-containing protein (c-di-GMP phosphodiesterase class II)